MGVSFTGSCGFVPLVYNFALLNMYFYQVCLFSSLKHVCHWVRVRLYTLVCTFTCLLLLLADFCWLFVFQCQFLLCLPFHLLILALLLLFSLCVDSIFLSFINSQAHCLPSSVCGSFHLFYLLLNHRLHCVLSCLAVYVHMLSWSIPSHCVLWVCIVYPGFCFDINLTVGSVDSYSIFVEVFRLNVIVESGCFLSLF